MPWLQLAQPDPVRLADQGSRAALGWGKGAGGRGAEREVCSVFGDVIASQCAVKFNTSRIY